MSVYSDQHGHEPDNPDRDHDSGAERSRSPELEKSVRDLRYFEHGYDAPEGSDLGSMRDQRYRDSLARGFGLAGYDDKVASSLDAELTNSEWFDRIRNYGLIDAISGRSAASQWLSRGLDFGLSFTPLGRLMSAGDLALDAFNNGLTKNVVRKGINVIGGRIADPMLRSALKAGGLAALGDSRGAVRTLGGAFGGMIGNELLPGIGGQLGSMAGSYLSSLGSVNGPSLGSGFGKTDHDSGDIGSYLSSSTSSGTLSPKPSRAGQDTSGTDWNQLFSKAMVDSGAGGAVRATNMLGANSQTGKATDFNSYGQGDTIYSPL